MEHTWLLHNLIVALGLLEECSAFPIHLGAGGVWSAGVASPLTPIALGAATLLAAVVLLVGCVCCRQQKGFQEFTDSVVSSQNNLAAVPATAPNTVYGNRASSELTLFPPLGTTLPQPGDRSSVVHFEPLPDIHVVAAAAAAARRKPAAFGNTPHLALSVHDWFEEPIENFPRHQLQYLRELGRGWFGRVVEGKAKDIISGHATSKVIVKILHEDATSTDQSYFLHEAKPYRVLKHPNILRLIGKCLETQPFLLLLEDCSAGSLKTFLIENHNNSEKLGKPGVLLEMAFGVAAGLHHMVENGFVHTDLAARNCLVTSDLTVKVGDYGTSIETFKDEYYCVGDLAIPIRWVAPETLHCTDTTIETKEVTASANVWSLAVVVWEICELGKLPYSDLSDEEVIEQVLGGRSTFLPFPSYESQPHVHNLYHLMKICWVDSSKRPPLGRVVAMLQHLLQHKNSPAHTSANNNNNSTTSLDDFERRWELSKPNTVPKIDNQVGSTSMHSSPVKSIQLQRCSSLEGSITASQPSQLELNLSADRASAACSEEPQLSVTSSMGGEVFIPSSLLAAQKSPSLQNLRGSVDELNVSETKDGANDKSLRQAPETVKEELGFDSWLQGMDTSTEEDVRFVRNISEAIRDLDEVLAQERTSSSSQNSSAQPSPSQVTLREVKPEGHITSNPDHKFTLDFRLGQAAASSLLLSRNIGLLHSNGHESLSLSQHRLESSGSDTEDETWRIRIERGEFSEKVKEKSKSVADLMVLTHIDYSDGSDSDTTLDLDPCGSSFRKNGVGRRSFTRKPLQSSSSVLYGSEGNIHQAVLGEEFQETIKKLQESLRDGSKLETIPDASLTCITTSSGEVQDDSQPDRSNFLAKLASEKNTSKNDDGFTAPNGSHIIKAGNPENVEVVAQDIVRHTEREIASPIFRSPNLSSENISGPSQVSGEDAIACIASNDLIIEHANEGKSATVHRVNILSEMPLTSTPLPAERKPRCSPAGEGLELDSSLMCSQTISTLGSEKEDSTSKLSFEDRPLSPTPMLKSNDSSCVIIGPFEDSTLDYFKGLKTTFPAVQTLDYNVNNEMDLEENSIETWDKFLDHAMHSENCEFPSFSDVTFPKLDCESPVSVGNVPSDLSDILGSSFERSVSDKMTISSPNGLVATETEPAHEEEEPKKREFNLGEVKALIETRLPETEVIPTLLKSTFRTEGQTTSCLVVPSVHVTEATPISSGRSSPIDLISEVNGRVCSASKVRCPDNVTEESDLKPDIKIISECGEMSDPVAKELHPQNETAECILPEQRLVDICTQKFDPDLPCCNQSVENFVLTKEMGTDQFLFSSSNISPESGTSFSHCLTSDCFINAKLDGDIMDKDFKPVIPLFAKGFDHKEADVHTDLLEDEDEFGLGVAKNLTPDDERSSDSGFRDKGSLSESCEDACDEKYNLEDIEAELEEAFSKGVFARHDSPTSNKGVESDCDVVDESFSVTLTDVEKQREQREADKSRAKDPCHRLDDLLKGDPTQDQFPVDVESSVDFFGESPALSPIPQSSGWFLHPPQSHEEPSSEPVSGNDSSYFSFSLDEEFVNAIRNELREKLPCAQMQREETQPQLSDDEEHSDQDLDSEDSPSRERTSITINYKTYPAPLSPILEERESICSDIGSPIFGYDSSSCSEQMSPVFGVDQSPSNQGDGDVRHGESECPAEVDGDLSDDCGDCGDFDEISDHCSRPVGINAPSPSGLSHVNDLLLNDDGEENDLDDDVLVVNTETNEATLLESPKPTNKFTFGCSEECEESSNEDFVPDFLSVAGSYQLPESNVERIRSDLYRVSRTLSLSQAHQSSVDFESEYDNNAMTPDSITCEKSFSERTEDSAVGLALSEVLTPDSLDGESPWTSTQMCDSGFGTIGTRPSSSALLSDSSERKSPESNNADFSPVEPNSAIEVYDNMQVVSGKDISSQDAHEIVESVETVQSAEESESSVSVSSNSVIVGPNVPLVSLTSVEAIGPKDEDKTNVSSLCPSNPSTVQKDGNDIKADVKSFITEEAKLSSILLDASTLPLPTFSKLSPQSLKEMARIVIENDLGSKVNTLAFNNDDLSRNNQAIPRTHCVLQETCQNTVVAALENVSKGDFVSKSLKAPSTVVNQPLQTLAFSDPEVVERPMFSGAGHIVVSSMITPLTPCEETITPGTLAFNDSPESPCEVLTCVLKENDPSEAESHLMSTSFMSAEDLYDDQDNYCPDWESGSDGCESETASSSSGEFIWKTTFHQTQPEFPMSSILEEEEEDEDGTGSSSCSSDSEDDAEFVPSAWDSQATPSRSALRSPDKKADQKKNVSFKRQRYHCVYEYPRELSDSDGSEFTDSPSRRRMWDLEGGTYNLHEWDLPANEGLAEIPCQDECRDEQITQASSQRLFQFCKIGGGDYSFDSTMLSEDGEFFISSSAQPFHTLGEVGASGSSEFFPGRDLTVSSVDDTDVVDGAVDSTLAVNSDLCLPENQTWQQSEEFSDSDSDTNMVTASEGSFNQQRSGDSNSSSTPMLTANGSSKSSDDSSIYHSLPTNQELQVDSGSDSPLSELSPPSPLSPMSPSHGLGELRHTRDRLKLDLPSPNTTFVLVAPCKKRSVEQVKGEASLLDGEDIFEGRNFKSNSNTHVGENIPVSSDVH